MGRLMACPVTATLGLPPDAANLAAVAVAVRSQLQAAVMQEVTTGSLSCCQLMQRVLLLTAAVASRCQEGMLQGCLQSGQCGHQ